MSYADTMAAMDAKRKQIEALKGEIRTLQAEVEPQAVEDYVLAGWDGPVRLSALFGDKRDLIVIHNMGAGCPACTMWADGFNGVYEHLAHRAAFVLASPNPVEAQKRFAKSRGWRFPMVSYEGSAFAEDMGFRHRGDYPADDAMGGWNPGVSIFRRDGERIVRLSEAEFDDHDGFCVVFSLFDLIPGAYDGWRPSNSYA
ncbi:MAG TPA: DUF899 family protein [Caulobacteraceae bacterium]|jgi:predicted dithiol-disulfide oxidoreductase (DUF899 family)|nr:DUF899 family protein [Caulobacteraceae bacterium]